MSRKTLLILIISLVAVTVVAYLGLRAKNESRISINFKRLHRQNVLKFVRAIELPFRVVEMKLFQGQLFVYNGSDQKIILVDTLGGILKSWGKRGKGPGEFLLIIGWDVDREGVYAADIRKLTITEMNYADSVTLSYNFKLMFDRAHRLEKNKYLIKGMDPQSSRRELFQLLDISSDSIKVLNFRLPRVENDMSLDGVFAKNERGQNFYICHRAGYFCSFDARGEFLYGKETVDRTPPSRMIEHGSGIAVDPTSQLVNISLSATDKLLYVLSRAIANGDQGKEIVDVYDVKDGSYKWSFNIPTYEGASALAIAVGPNGLYAVEGQKIVYYDFETPPQ